MRLKKLTLAVLTILIFTSTSICAQSITMQKSIKYDTRIVVTGAVINQCKLQTKIPHYIQLYSKKNGIAMNLTTQNLSNVNGQVLEVKIVHVTSHRGGAWSGPKSVTISGMLKKEGKLVAKFTAERRTGGGAFGAYKGTCSLLGRCAKTIGQDVARWLKNPVNGTHLGDSTSLKRRGL